MPTHQPERNALQTQRLALSALTLDPSNPRIHPTQNREAIAASLKRFGQTEPLIIQRGTRRVIAGNARLQAMQALGWTECTVIELDIENLEAKALGIALNRTAELADWDDSVLANLLLELRTEGALEGLGFSECEIDSAIFEAGLESGLDADLDLVPALPERATTRRGDLWLLGSHRLLCGDSSKASELKTLLSGAPIHLINTDPPYNVRVEPRSNNAIARGRSSSTNTHHQGLDLARHPHKAKATHQKLRPKDRPLLNDFVSEEEFTRLLDAWFQNAAGALEPGRAFYIWGGYANLANYPGALERAGLYFSQAIVWNKLHPVLTRKDFMGAFELAFYGWKEGAAHKFYGPASVTDLWEVKKVNPQSMVHLTEKPVELAIRAMQYSTVRGEHVLDLFGGSGSSLVAAQQTDRRAFLMELDELYCDVIVQRYEQLSGKQAMHAQLKLSFEQLRAQRAEAEEKGSASPALPTHKSAGDPALVCPSTLQHDEAAACDSGSNASKGGVA